MIEQKRVEVTSSVKTLTPVTLQSFVAWKKRKLREKAENEQKENDKKKQNAKAGMTVGMSGRDMFTFDPKMMSNMVCEYFFVKLILGFKIVELFKKYMYFLNFLRTTMMKKMAKHTICLKCQGKMVRKRLMNQLKFMKLNLMNLELWKTD